MEIGTTRPSTTTDAMCPPPFPAAGANLSRPLYWLARRPVSAVLFLAWARLTHRPSRWLLVALGVAAATVLPMLSASSATIVATQALRYGVAQLPPGQRTLIVSFPSIRLPSD